MARAALQRRLTWLVAEVVAIVDETRRAKTIVFHCPRWPGHLAGQHIDIRLTAPDGYEAQRSYSIATPADGERLAITVERVVDGEVSPFLLDELVVGDRLEMRGPIGGYFVWDPEEGVDPLLLVGGGSGLVPLMAMLRAHLAAGSAVPVRVLVSARSVDDLLYREELAELGEKAGISAVVTLTREHPEGWTGHRRRVDQDLLAEVAWRPDEAPLCFVCGPTGFVETVAAGLIDIGHPAHRIRTERFGPTGGTT